MPSNPELNTTYNRNRRGGPRLRWWPPQRPAACRRGCHPQSGGGHVHRAPITVDYQATVEDDYRGLISAAVAVQALMDESTSRHTLVLPSSICGIGWTATTTPGHVRYPLSARLTRSNWREPGAESGASSMAPATVPTEPESSAVNTTADTPPSRGLTPEPLPSP